MSEEKCDLCGRNLVIKSGRFGRFLACPGYPECNFTKPLVVEMPGRCPKCGGRILKKTSKTTGYTYYGCEHNSDKDEATKCDFMTWDVPVKDDCPVCGQTMFKKSGRGFKKPFCINPACSNFTPEEKRGGYRKKTAKTEEGPTGPGSGGGGPGEHQEDLRKEVLCQEAPQRRPGEDDQKTATKKAAAKKTAAEEETTEKQAGTKKTTAKKTASRKAAASENEKSRRPKRLPPRRRPPKRPSQGGVSRSHVRPGTGSEKGWNYASNRHRRRTGRQRVRLAAGPAGRVGVTCGR